MKAARLPFPIRGASDAAAFGDFDPNFTAPEALRNVRAYGPRSKRARGARRPGMIRAFDLQLAGEPQAMIALSKASSQTGTTLGSETPFGSGFTRDVIDFFFGNAHMRDSRGGFTGAYSSNLGGGSTAQTWDVGIDWPVGEGALARGIGYISGVNSVWVEDYTLNPPARAAAGSTIQISEPFSGRWVYLLGNNPSSTGKTGWIMEMSPAYVEPIRFATIFGGDGLPTYNEQVAANPCPQMYLNRSDLLAGVIPVGTSGTNAYTDDDPGGDTSFPANDIWVTEHWILMCLKNGILCVSKERTDITAEGNRPAQAWWYDLNGWSNETIAVVASSETVEDASNPDASFRECFCLFQGSWTAGTVDNGAGGSETLRAFRWGGHFRAGIDRFTIDDRPPSVRNTETLSPIVKRGFGDKLASGDRYFESSHRTFRFSEHLERAPRGCWPEDMAIDPDGKLIVAFSNTGYGPNESDPQHLPNAAGWRATTLAKIDPGDFSFVGIPPAGSVEWEVDTRSNLISAAGLPPVDGTNFDSDMPHDTGVDATLRAVTTGPGGRIYCGGNRTGGNVFCLNPGGIEQWIQDVGSIVRQGAMSIDESDGNVIVGAASNTAWVSSTLNAGNTVEAHAWRLDSQTGSVRQFFDLPDVARINTFTATPTFDQKSPITAVHTAPDGDILFGHWFHDGSP